MSMPPGSVEHINTTLTYVRISEILTDINKKNFNSLCCKLQECTVIYYTLAVHDTIPLTERFENEYS